MVNVFKFFLYVFIFSVLLFLYLSKTVFADDCGVNVYDKLDAAFKLTDFNGKPISDATFKNKNILWVYFGYTSCPDACPVTLGNVKRAYPKIKNAEKEVRVMMVTIDPERDTAQKLKAYLGFFNKHFIGAIGDKTQLANAAKAFGVNYFPSFSESKAGKLFTHTDRVFMVDKQGRLRGIYRTENVNTTLIDETEKLLSCDVS